MRRGSFLLIPTLKNYFFVNLNFGVFVKSQSKGLSIIILIITIPNP